MKNIFTPSFFLRLFPFCFFLLLMHSNAFAQPGNLDLTFLTGNGPIASVRSTVIQTDEKIIIGGDFTKFNGNLVNKIARLNTNGSFDNSFLPNFNFNQVKIIYSIALQADGKILVSGLYSNPSMALNPTFLVRLNVDGSMDNTFNSLSLIPEDFINVIKVLPNGQILIGGSITNLNSTGKNYAARLNSNGTLDASFVPAFPVINGFANAIEVQNDGKIIIAGPILSNFAGPGLFSPIVRLNMDGSIDPTFQPILSGDYAVIGQHDLYTISLQTNGKIIVGGQVVLPITNKVVGYISRLNADGSLDGSFSNAPGIIGQAAYITKIQTDGKILVGGVWDSFNGITKRGLFRLNSNGTLDNSFNPGGIGFNVNGGLNSISMYPAPDDRLIVGGGFDTYNSMPINNVARIATYLAPVIICPANISVNTDSGTCTAVVNYTASITGFPDPQSTNGIKYSMSGATSGSDVGIGSGSVFNKGVTTVELIAANLAGYTTCLFTVTVSDNEHPIISCSPDIQINNLVGSCGANATASYLTATDNCGLVTVVGTRSDEMPLTALYQVGSTTVTWTATDSIGLTSFCSQKITVIDNEAPVINCYGVDTTINSSPGLCGGFISLPTSATDNCGVASATAVRSDNLALTDIYPIGQTDVIWLVTDIHGNISQCSALVRVVDNEEPILTCSGNIIINNEPGQCGAHANPQYTATDNCGVYSVEGFRSDGAGMDDIYRIGVTTVTWKISGREKVTSECSLTVTVVDTEAPVFECRGNIFVNNELGKCGAKVVPINFAQDNCEGFPVIGVRSDGLSVDELYPVGTTTVTWTATDNNGLTGQCIETITVSDVEAPVITCAENISANNTMGLCGAYATPLYISATDNCGTPNVVGIRSDELALTALYPVGITTITWTATDSQELSTQCIQTVTVIDTENPIITCSPNITINNTTGLCSANATPSYISATDNCGAPTVVGIRSDGLALTALYPVGTTTVTWKATDTHGLTKQCAQTITVNDNQAPVISCAANITINAPRG